LPGKPNALPSLKGVAQTQQPVLQDRWSRTNLSANNWGNNIITVFSRAMGAALLLSATASPLNAATTSPGRIPQEFIGKWTSSASSCGTDPDAILTINASSVALGGSAGTLLFVSRTALRSIDITLRYTRQGRPLNRLTRLKLSASGNDLTSEDGSEPVTRHRCRASAEVSGDASRGKRGDNG
jgi:hypothetical protein